MAESMIGLYKTEVIHHLGPYPAPYLDLWKSASQIEWETLNWVSWYNEKRLHSANHYQTPNKKENQYFQNQIEDDKAA